MVSQGNIPDIYADSVQLGLSEWGVVLGFAATTLSTAITQEQQPQDVQASGPTKRVPMNLELKALVRMTPQHAKAFAIILKRQLKAYEEREGKSYLAMH